MFSAFRQFLHALCLLQVGLHRPSNLEGNPISVMAHGSSPDGFGHTLVPSLLGVCLEDGCEFEDFCRPLLQEDIEVEIPTIHKCYYIIYYLIDHCSWTMGPWNRPQLEVDGHVFWQ